LRARAVPSALAFFAYRAGLPAEAVLRLFRREVFAALGYFQLWRGATDALLEQGRQFGLDLSADFLRWANRGCFMYSAGRASRSTSTPTRSTISCAATPSRSYPEIAEFYGVSGSYIFKASHYQLSKGLGKFWDLPGYISDCYRIYAEHRPEQLVNERVQGWLLDASASKLLRDFAAAPASSVAAAA
jgi:hypothetical protein